MSLIHSLPQQIGLSEQIYQYLFRTVDAEGYESVSTRKISAEVGATTGAIYTGYRSKDDMLAEVCYQARFILNNSVKRSINSGDFSATVRRLLGAPYSYAQDRQNFYRLHKYFQSRDGKLNLAKIRSNRLKQIDQQRIDVVVRCIQRAQRRRQLAKHFNPEDLARVLLAMADGMAENIGDPRLIDLAGEIVIKGLKSPW